MWTAAFLLLAAAGTAAAAAAMAAFALHQQRTRLARGAAVVAIATVLLYAAALFIVGDNEAAQLGIGDEKYICELDCHFAYAVLGMERDADDVVVRMRMRFDATTTSPKRDDRPLTPGDRNVALIDESGSEHAVVHAGGLATALRPGEATEATLTFRLPSGAKPRELRFEDADPVKKLLIGSETALLHRSARFQLAGS